MKPPHIATQCAPPNNPARTAAIKPETGIVSVIGPARRTRPEGSAVQRGGLALHCSRPASPSTIDHESHPRWHDAPSETPPRTQRSGFRSNDATIAERCAGAGHLD